VAEEPVAAEEPVVESPDPVTEPVAVEEPVMEAVVAEEPVADEAPESEPFYAAEPVAVEMPAEEPVLFVEPAVEAVVEPEPVEVEEPVAAQEPALFEDEPVMGPLPSAEESEFRSASQPDEAPAVESFEADEHLSEFRAAWSTADAEDESAEAPFVAERTPTPFMADEPAEDEPNVPWFVADVQEPAPKAEPSPSKTDTWSGRALGS